MPTGADIVRCTDCRHHKTIYGDAICAAGTQAVRADAMRHKRGDCGPDASMFEPKDGATSSELDWD